MRTIILTLALAFIGLAQTEPSPVAFSNEERLTIQLAQEQAKSLALEMANMQMRFPIAQEEQRTAQSKAQAAISGACDRAKIPRDECRPDLGSWTMTRVPKPKPPKPEAKK